VRFADAICRFLRVQIRAYGARRSANAGFQCGVLTSGNHLQRRWPESMHPYQLEYFTGRAGRPQFDTSAVAVIMTQAQHVLRYQGLASGHEPVESRLHRCLAEFVNAEVAMRSVTSWAQAQAWLRSTFFWTRLFQNPGSYGLHDVPLWQQQQQGQAAQAQGAAAAAHVREQLAREAVHTYLKAALDRLEGAGLLRIDRASGAIEPLDPGTCAPDSQPVPLCERWQTRHACKCLC
jgi:hypothetical protein